MTSYFELWTEQDQSHLELFLDGLQQYNLTTTLLAIEGVEPDRAKLVHKQLEHWAEQVQKVIQRGSVTHPAEALRLVLVDVLELGGNSDDYSHPRNSHLSSVVQERCGLPILLSAVWMIVGELAGISVRGVGLPGHFLVKVEGEEEQLIDPFDNGKTLTVVDCQAIVSRLYQNSLPWREQFLDTTSLQDMLERVLRNLVSIYSQREDLVQLYRTIRFFSELRPELPDLLLNQAKIAELSGETVLALEAYRLFQERFPDADELEAVNQKVEALGMRTQMLH